MAGDRVVVTTEAELVEALRTPERWRVVGSGAHEHFRRPAPVDTSELRIEIRGLVDFSPNDQVVVVRAGTPLEELQEALRPHGQCLPVSGEMGTVGGLVSLNLPHALEAECGTWRDWVLGCAAVRADGTAVRAGSRAVKNVAGYDVHKFLVGTRGTLAVLTELTLRTYPLRSLPTSAARYRQGGRRGDTFWIQRTLPTDFSAAVEASAEYEGFDLPTTSTLWRQLPSDATLPRFSGDWVIRAGCGDGNAVVEGPAQARLMRRTKELFDPTDRLNPGEFGL